MKRMATPEVGFLYMSKGSITPGTTYLDSVRDSLIFIVLLVRLGKRYLALEVGANTMVT